MVTRRARLVLLCAVAMLSTACNPWTQFGYGPGNTRSSGDTSISLANVGSLTPAWSAETNASTFSSPAVAGGLVFVGSGDGRVLAFDADGSTSCTGSPGTCTPVWTASTGGAVYSSPAVSDGVVFVGSDDGNLYAFDADGVEGCSGSPVVCEPLWTAPMGGPVKSSPEVSGGIVHVASTDGSVYNFDATGTTGCSGAPKTCTPLFRSQAGGSLTGSPAVLSGVLYIGSSDAYLYAFSADGSTGCSGSPKVCQPLWKAMTGGAIKGSAAVSGNTAFVGSADGTVYGFSRTGSAGCAGIPKTCTPVWSAYVGAPIESSPAVAGGRLFIGGSTGPFAAFDATGATNCTGVPKACSPLWTADTGGGSRSSPAVVNGVVFVGTRWAQLLAFDAAGELGCAGTPVVCQPRWSYTAELGVDSSPAVSDGFVYVGSDDAHLYAFETTASPVPVPPTVAKPEGIAGADEVTVRWSPAVRTDAPITGYVVRTYADGVLAGSTVVGPDVSSLTIPGAAPGVAYTFDVAVTVAGGTGPGAASALSEPEQAGPQFAPSAYQITPRHDGRQVYGSLAASPSVRWSVDLGNRVSYPVTGNGRVFVTSGGNGSGGYGARLYALDPADGSVLWGPVQIGGTYYIAGLAYEDHKVFVQSYSGRLAAFDEATGQTLWSTALPGQYSFTSAPTAYRGLVYTGGAGSGGTAYAVNAQTGAVLWARSVANGDHSSPAVDADGVYVSYACARTYRFHPETGTQAWVHTTGCSGGGGKTPVLVGDRLYVRDGSTSSVVLETAGGTSVDSFGSTTAPAFGSSWRFDRSGSTLSAVDPATNASKWTRTADGTLSSAAIVFDGEVIVGGTSGLVVAYDEVTGAQTWTVSTGHAVEAPDEQNAWNLTGMGAAGDTLFVSAGNWLVAIR